MDSILSGHSVANSPYQINLHKSSGENLQNIIRNAGGGQLGNEHQNSTSALNDSTTLANQKRMKHLSEQSNMIDEKDKKLKEMQMLRL